MTTLTYELRTGLDDVFEKLTPLAKVRDEDHINDVTHDASGAVMSASLSWVKAGNRQHKEWDNTILGTLRLEQGRLVAEVNSARRADRLKREIAKHLGEAATLRRYDGGGSQSGHRGATHRARGRRPANRAGAATRRQSFNGWKRK